MEEDRDEFERAVVSINQAKERWSPFIGGEGQCCKTTGAVMDRDREAAANAKLRRLIHQLSLLRR